MSRLPETGPSLMRWLRQQERQAQRQANSSSFNRSGVTVGVDGLIIPNDVLVSPVVPGAIYFSATNFALDTTLATKASSTVTVPPDVTSAVVSVVSRVLAVNHATDGADSFRSTPVVDAFSGAAMWTPTVPGFGSWGVDVAPLTAVLTGLTPGSTIALAVKAQTSGYVWPSDTFNVAEMSGSILWFR